MADVIERPPSFEELNAQARAYPSYLLPHGGTALALFSAGFWGWNDVIHLASAEMRVTCVDLDKDKLWEMAEVYPEGWVYRVEDAWAFAEHHVADVIMYDVVTIDPWTQTIAEALESLPLWCSLARSVVTIGCFMEGDLPPIPEDWKSSIFPRNENVGWLVLTR